jgi:mono/diheme cytochrome c family protein
MKHRTLRSLAAAAVMSFIIWPCASLAQTAGAAQVAAGERVYSDYCSNCHGEGLRNTSGGVTFDLRRLRSEERDRFVGAVLDGKRQMPPWRGALDMEQIESIWAYIRATVDR